MRKTLKKKDQNRLFEYRKETFLFKYKFFWLKGTDSIVMIKVPTLKLWILNVLFLPFIWVASILVFGISGQRGFFAELARMLIPSKQNFGSDVIYPKNETYQEIIKLTGAKPR